MRLFKTLFVLSICLVFATGISIAQICGDASGDNQVNVVDMAKIADYIGGLPGTINLDNADCDGVSGVTLSDLVTICNSVFRTGSLNCITTGSYSFAPTNDTIHILRVTDVPADVDEVYLLVAGSFSSVADGISVPIHGNGPGSSNLFDINAVFGLNNNVSGGSMISQDEWSLFFVPLSNPNLLDGTNNLLMLKYTRTAAGVGSVLPEAYDRPDPWKIAVARNNDLYTPEIVYHDSYYPDGILQLSDDDLHFDAIVDSPSPNTYEIAITHATLDVGFKLSSTTPWINIDQTTGVTPATVTVTADATGLGVFEYNGKINVYYDGFQSVIDTIGLTMTVHPLGNPTFPPGDVNCDGALNTLDMVYLINYFYRFGSAPFPCGN